RRRPGLRLQGHQGDRGPDEHALPGRRRGGLQGRPHGWRLRHQEPQCDVHLRLRPFVPGRGRTERRRAPPLRASWSGPAAAPREAAGGRPARAPPRRRAGPAPRRSRAPRGESDPMKTMNAAAPAQAGEGLETLRVITETLRLVTDKRAELYNVTERVAEILRKH